MAGLVFAKIRQVSRTVFEAKPDRLVVAVAVFGPKRGVGGERAQMTINLSQTRTRAQTRLSVSDHNALAVAVLQRVYVGLGRKHVSPPPPPKTF